MGKAKYVNPIIGTVGDEQADSIHGGGKTHPGACVPGGMVQLSPDTVTGGDNGTGYNYCNSTIEGFSFNHMSGIGWYGDLGNLQVMPVVGETDLRSGSNEEVLFEKGTIGWKSEFSHDKECARAGYYSVELERYKTLAEATVTEHTGILRFTFPKNSNAKVIFNFSRRIAGQADFQHIDIINNKCIEGFICCTPKGGGFGRGEGGISYKLYFVCEFSVPVKEMRFFSNEVLKEDIVKSFEAKDVGLLAELSEDLNEPVILRCGISYVDLEGARNNLISECNTFDFDKIAFAASCKWDDAFKVIDVEGSDETDITLFYTCLYHALLDPRSAMDNDGRFVLDGKMFKGTGYTQRTMFSGWDVYRSEFPLLTIIRPDIVNDEVNSLLKIAELKNSSFPRWELMGIDSRCMVGDPGLIVIADAYIKGIQNFDYEKAYEIALTSSKCADKLYGKKFTSFYPKEEQYIRKAYVPNSLSCTLEYLLADYVMSKFAEKLGCYNDANYYMDRAMRYRENYDSRLGFMAPRDENGVFLLIKDEYDEKGCVESNIKQQSWFVPYDIKGLSKLFGEERTVELLEGFFDNADFSALWNVEYNHSNEPCHNITHYFDLLGLAHRTQYWTRRVQKEAYRISAFGFCGNEDVGQLSAWYVLSALGFAQICPGTGIYFVNTPLFKKAKIKLNAEYHSCSIGDTFSIECDNDPLEFAYIKAMKLNNKEVKKAYLTYSEITDGGKLEIILSKTPVTEFGLED